MLGAIADDFTGATDLATMLRRSGHRTAVVMGDRAPAYVEGFDAVVVALKTRTAPIADALRSSLDAVDWLRRNGATRFYVKYCSTFDSTPTGNIGPILDAVRDQLGAERSVVVPSLPANGRTVYQGHLFVGAELLENSSMRHHPLTPMTRSRVADLLRAQTEAAVAEVHRATVSQGSVAVRRAMDGLATPYAVIDAVDDDDLRVIADAVEGELLVSGGSGLALGLRGPGGAQEDWSAPEARSRVVLCGSVSATSLNQIAVAAETQPVHTLDLRAAAQDSHGAEQEIVDWIQRQPAGSIPVVCAARRREDVVGRDAGFDAAPVVESVLAGVARRLVEQRISSELISAGGETSGAVVGALGASVLRIGPEIAPGICWSLADTPGGVVALALKSGNFGEADMFLRAWEVLR